jgi:hypothetical protein
MIDKARFHGWRHPQCLVDAAEFKTADYPNRPFLDTVFSALYPYILLPERLSSLCALPRAFAVI